MNEKQMKDDVSLGIEHTPIIPIANEIVPLLAKYKKIDCLSTLQYIVSNVIEESLKEKPRTEEVNILKQLLEESHNLSMKFALIKAQYVRSKSK